MDASAMPVTPSSVLEPKRTCFRSSGGDPACGSSGLLFDTPVKFTEGDTIGAAPLRSEARELHDVDASVA
jgi:hypothetical protein